MTEVKGQTPAFLHRMCLLHGSPSVSVKRKASMHWRTFNSTENRSQESGEIEQTKRTRRIP